MSPKGSTHTPGPSRISVPATSIAPALTRASLRSLGPALGERRLQDLLLLATEVVTNAVRHATSGGDDVEVLVDVQRERVRLEVRDPGPGFEPRATPDPSAWPDPDAGGWGLYLVERLAERWGVERRPGGTVVWFELDLDPS